MPDWYANVALDEELAETIRSAPGTVWIIGNEIERGPNPGETWSARTDDMFADMYVEAYHDIYHFIKGIDPTARIANAGLIQITPMRLQYLDLMWDAYLQKFGVPMPVDVWTIHTYVLPELTPTGKPNDIASAALGTELALGKRASGNDTSKCADPGVFCYAEHDDPSLLEEQVVSMRQWMKDHNQQDKPLVVTEYGTLYHYKVKEDGSCGLRDEFGKCFTPERVSKFMIETFDYFTNAHDPNIGFPADNNKLIQQWIWYGAWNWDIASSNLLQDDLQTLTLMGETYRDHVFAEPTHVNLNVGGVSGTVVSQDENGTVTAHLSVEFRNNGNIAIQEPFSVTFFEDAELTQPIDSTTITPIIRGCATQIYISELEWEVTSLGTHPFWVKIDSNNVIRETDETDNIGFGQFASDGSLYTLDVQIISEGDGPGGVVSATPTGPTYPGGTIVSLDAVPYSGWTFAGWKGAVNSTNLQVTVTMTRDKFVEAHFVQDHYALLVDVIGEGEVTISPEQNNYLYGDQVTIAAKPSPGWRFVEWRGDIESGAPLIEHSFNSDLSITAVFENLLPTVTHTAYYPVSMSDS